jgi:SAM-dependent MidA family methyltransferase
LARASGSDDWLAQRIRASGRRWRFDEAVDALLYDPLAGFYGSGRGAAGRRGDFITSPEVGPLFGASLARALDLWWDELARPQPFVVAEAGAGAGMLARAVLAAQPECAAALQHVTVERSASLRASQPAGVDRRQDLPNRAHVVLANELLDNLPFRLVEWRDGVWREVLVDDALGEVLGDPVGDGRLPSTARDGSRAPLQDAAAAWVGQARRRSVGPVVAFDYTSTTESMVGRSYLEWVRTYRGHERGGVPLDAPGSQDVTCEVAVDQLPAPVETLTQADALRAWGIDDLVADGRRIWNERAHVGDLAAMRARSRVREADALLDPEGLGGFMMLRWSGEAS